MPNNWDDLKDGMLAEFCFMKLDIDSHSKLTRDKPKAKVISTLNEFEKYIEKHISKFNGRLWTWAGDGGLVAFIGNDSAERAVSCAINILSDLTGFNRFISTIDEDIKVRIAIHVGTAKYNSINPGRIHSDDINFVSHLEDKFAFSNDICISQYAYSELTPIGKSKFKEVGSFQDKHIFSMHQKIRDRAIVHYNHRVLPKREESLDRWFNEQLRIFTTTADNYFSDDGVRVLIETKLHLGYKVRVLLLDPRSPFFEDRERQEKAHFDKRQDASIANMQGLKDKFPDNVELRFFNIAPTYQALIIDDYIMFIAINIYGTTGTADFPCLQIVNGPETKELFEKFTEAFEKLWKISDKIL